MKKKGRTKEVKSPEKSDKDGVVEFVDTEFMELTGGEVRISRLTRIFCFGSLLLVSLFQFTEFLYLEAVYDNVWDFLSDMSGLMDTMYIVGFWFGLLIHFQFFFDLFRTWALFDALKRDFDPDNLQQNPPPPFFLYILSIISMAIIPVTLVGLYIFSSNLKDLSETFMTMFLEKQPSYLKDMKVKRSIDKFQLTQMCCGMDKNGTVKDITARWKSVQLYPEEDQENSDIAAVVKDFDPSNWLQVPFSCCNSEVQLRCHPNNKDVRAYSNASCDTSMHKLAISIGQSTEALIFFFVLTEMICSVSYNILLASMTDEYINKQRPSIVRLPFMQFFIYLIGAFLFYAFFVKYFEFPSFSQLFREGSNVSRSF